MSTHDVRTAAEADEVARLRHENELLRRESKDVANANAHAAELMIELEDTRDDLSAANETLQEQKLEIEAAKARVEREHAFQEQLFLSIHSILIGIDADGRITQWNAAAEKTFGTGASAAIGRNLEALDIEWEWPEVRQSIEACPRSAEPVTLEASFVRTDGSGGTLSMTFSPIRDESGNAPGCLILGDDTTAKKLVEAQMNHAQKLESIGQLAAGIAHEINTPIQYVGDNIRFIQTAFDDLRTAIRGLTEATAKDRVPAETTQRAEEILEEAELDYLDEELPSAFRQAIDGVGRVAKIVAAMKEFSHPSHDSPEPVDLNGAIETTITVARGEWKYAAEVKTDLEPDLPPVSGLRDELNQVFLNMIVNAAHAIGDVVGDGSDGKGTITIGTRSANDCVEVSISDTGSGIPEEVRARIFDPFFTTKEVGKGTGQGLSIAHGIIVQKHDGTIDVESEVGRGTTFRIRLPIAPA